MRAFSLYVVSGFFLLATLFESFVLADESNIAEVGDVVLPQSNGHAKENQKVEFLVGDYLVKEGGRWDAEKSPLHRPFGIAFDSKDRMYVVEFEGGRVHRFDSDGTIKKLAGEQRKDYRGDGGPAIQAVFNGMHNLAITDADQLLISDTWNQRIRRIDLETQRIETFAGTGAVGFKGDGSHVGRAQFHDIMCISISPDQKFLHVTDLKNRRVRNIDLETKLVVTVVGNGEKGVPVDGAKATESPLVDPRAAASDQEGHLYVLERGGNALRVVDSEGIIRTVAGSGERGFRDGIGDEVAFGAPKHLCLDHQGRVYIADDLNGAIRRYDPKSNRVTTILGRGFGDSRIQLLNPHGVCVHDGYLYVADSSQHRIMRLSIR